MSRPGNHGRVDHAWLDSWTQANRDFYASHYAERHFQTPVHASTRTAHVIANLLSNVEESTTDPVIIDIGSGSGELLRQLSNLAPECTTLIGVDQRPRPDDLPASITWHQLDILELEADFHDLADSINGILIAHEFLDDIACPIVELDDEVQPRIVLVDPATGTEDLGPHLDDPAADRYLGDTTRVEASDWLTQWWPPTRPLARREIGTTRDRVWRNLTQTIDNGYCVAVDYAHSRQDRVRGVWDGGTIKGFANGVPQSAVPNGSVNITAHVALDSCAGPASTLHRQSELLGDASLDSWPPELGSFTWLIERRGTVEMRA